MTETTTEIAVDAALARRLIGDAFPSLELRALEPAGEGFDNLVWRVNGDLLFRFPRREVAIPGVRREMALLPLLAPLLPVAIPQPAYQAGPDPDAGYPWPFFGGPFIPGRESCEADLDDDARAALATPLAEALRALHAPETSAALAGHHLPVDPMGRADIGTRVRKAREALGVVQRVGMWSPNAFVLDLLNGARSLRTAPAATVVTHGDLHFRHLLVGDAGTLSGIIDWGDVCLGSPAIDLQVFWSFLPPSARPAFVRAYGPIGQENLLRARVLAFNLNAVLAIYGHRNSLPAIKAEAIASLRRAASD